MIYTGDLFPAWKGDAFLGALSGEALVRVDLDGEAASPAENWPMGARIRAVAEDPDGAIWLLEDGGRGPAARTQARIATPAAGPPRPQGWSRLAAHPLTVRRHETRSLSRLGWPCQNSNSSILTR